MREGAKLQTKFEERHPILVLFDCNVALNGNPDNSTADLVQKLTATFQKGIFKSSFGGLRTTSDMII